jgi:hypothetical protein
VVAAATYSNHSEDQSCPDTIGPPAGFADSLVMPANEMGRSAAIDAIWVRETKGQGLGATAIAKTLSIGRASLYRVLEGRP